MEERTYEYEPVVKHNGEMRKRQLYERLLRWCLREKTSSTEKKPEEIGNERKNGVVCTGVE